MANVRSVFDAEGRFWLAGRVHSTILRDGKLVHPQLVEQAARGDDPQARRVAAVGVPDPDLGEKVVVFTAGLACALILRRSRSE